MVWISDEGLFSDDGLVWPRGCVALQVGLRAVGV